MDLGNVVPIRGQVAITPDRQAMVLDLKMIYVDHAQNLARGGQPVDVGSRKFRLLKSSLERHGQIEPIAVRALKSPLTKGSDFYLFQLVAGYHRFEAMQQLGWDTARCRVFPEETDADTINFITNVVRNNGTRFQLAVGVKSLADKGKSVEEIVKNTGLLQDFVERSLRIMSLPKELIDAYANDCRDENEYTLDSIAQMSTSEGEDRAKIQTKAWEEALFARKKEAAQLAKLARAAAARKPPKKPAEKHIVLRPYHVSELRERVLSAKEFWDFNAKRWKDVKLLDEEHALLLCASLLDVLLNIDKVPFVPVR